MRWVSKPLLLAAVMLCACSAQAEPPKPLLWKVSDGDNEVYLLGSFHLLKTQDYPLARSVDVAFQDAEMLRFELPPEQMGGEAAAKAILGKAMLPPGETLQQRISPDLFQRLQRHAEAKQKPMQVYQRFKPWMVGLMLTLESANDAGMKAELGLDQHVLGLGKQAAKPAAGFETVEQQIGLFDSMSAKEQEEMLAQSLDESADPKAGDALYAAWRNGDDKTLWKLFASEANRYPELSKRINEDRNRAWLPQIRELLKASGDDQDVLVVVGALHLVGEVGLVKLLKDAGYRVERL